MASQYFLEQLEAFIETLPVVEEVPKHRIRHNTVVQAKQGVLTSKEAEITLYLPRHCPISMKIMSLTKEATEIMFMYNDYMYTLSYSYNNDHLESEDKNDFYSINVYIWRKSK